MRLTSIRTALFWGLCLLVALVSWRFLVLGVELSMPTMAHHLDGRALALYAHIGLAPIALAVLPAQFNTALRTRRPGLHRWTGRIYGVTILVSGIAGFSLALSTAAGPVAGAGFALLAVAWLCWVPNVIIAEWFIRRRPALAPA